MQLSGLTRLLADHPAVAEPAQSTETARLFGLLRAARPAVIAATAEHLPGALLVVVAHPQEAHELTHELPVWTDREVLHFPALETLPYERVHLDRLVLGEREAVLRALDAEGRGVIVATARAIMQPVRSRSAGSPVCVVKPGDVVPLDRLTAQWLAMGYEAVSLVEEPGTFARRGGVLDVFPSGAEHPVRIELFGNTVESMRTFDPISQRSLSSTLSVTLQEVAALQEDDRATALNRLRAIDISNLTAESETAWLDDLSRLESGASFDDLSLFLPYLISQPSLVIDHMSNAGTVLLNDGPAVWQAIEDLSQQARDIQRELEECGSLPRGLEPALFERSRISTGLERVRTMAWFPGSPEDQDAIDCSDLFRPARLYAGRLRSLLHDLKASPAETTVVASMQPERVTEMLEEEEIGARILTALASPPEPGVSAIQVALAEGWEFPAAGLTVLSDHELFGRARSRPVSRRPRPARDAFFTQFSPGDYVVHLEHGIGRFAGVTRMTIGGAEREYMMVQYAGADKVYVPTDQMERLTRYIGMGDTPPHLSKLGGGEWQRTRQRATQAAVDMARELVEVYSKRLARPAYAFSPDTPWQHELEVAFPYPETPDQLQAIAEVKAEMEQPSPMDRLVCADVGYGKTEVAVRAAFKAIADGKQVAVLVPTTILAQQHFETFTERFSPFPVTVEALSRFRSPAQQRDILRRLASGEVDVIIGTHRLLQKDVSFKNLGLLIVDEEQRFGVRHKEQLRRYRESIDMLTLTATPIPRTLHMGLVGIREISVIETPPEGRLPIQTRLQPYDDRLVREAVLRELDREGQVYLVHNRVTTIEAMAQRIRELVPEARVVVAHGQMDGALLEKVMLSFAHREADVLVCSTIIENGVDIPNVNTIVVNNAHRLGLTQLYQLRGRVGRSANQAYAYLFYPRDVHLNRDATRRLEAVFEARELGAGMNIAMKDLEIRGVGNLLGAEQSGHATAIGFDLYTRMIGEAVERMRGKVIEETVPITIDLPLTMFLPAEYVANESERLTLYRRLASIETESELRAFSDEITDRFGTLPLAVQNLLTSVRIKLAAKAAHVTLVSLDEEHLTARAGANAPFNRIALYRTYGIEARIATNVLRIPRSKLAKDWLGAIEQLLVDMASLRESLRSPEPVEA